MLEDVLYILVTTRSLKHGGKSITRVRHYRQAQKRDAAAYINLMGWNLRGFLAQGYVRTAVCHIFVENVRIQLRGPPYARWVCTRYKVTQLTWCAPICPPLPLPLSSTRWWPLPLSAVVVQQQEVCWNKRRAQAKTLPPPAPPTPIAAK